MSLTEEWLQVFEEEAGKRTQRHYASHRPLGKNHDVVGLIGEVAFATEFKLPLKLGALPLGDGGVDFIVPVRFKIDVKTLRKADNLLVEASKVRCDIYVLAHYSDDTKQATLIGWASRAEVLKAPTDDFGGGFQSHYIPREQLHPIAELHERMMVLA